MSFFNSISDKDVLNFFQALNLYVKAGIPEHNAIVRYGESVTHPVMKAMADDVVYRMENGMQLSQAMEQLTASRGFFISLYSHDYYR